MPFPFPAEDSSPFQTQANSWESSEFLATLSQKMQEPASVEPLVLRDEEQINGQLFMQPSVSANTKCWSLSVKKNGHNNRLPRAKQAIYWRKKKKNLLRATWLLESKTLIWSLMFSTTDVDFLDPESGLENINLKKKKSFT